MTGSPAFRIVPSRALSLSLAALLLAACASEPPPKPQAPATTKAQPSKPQKKPWKSLGPYTPGGLYAPGVSDGAPDVPPDVASLPEPVPHPEPLARYGNRSPYVVLGKSYTVLPSAAGYDERGMASWYGTKFDGRVTSSLEPYDLTQFSAAHRTLPLPSYARVTNLENGRSVIVRINDRGPFHEGRLIDLSYAAAIKLGVNVHGTAMVEVKGIDTGHPDATPPAETAASARPSPPRSTPAEPKKFVAKPAPPMIVAAPVADMEAKATDASPRPDVASANPKNPASSPANAEGTTTTPAPIERKPATTTVPATVTATVAPPPQIASPPAATTSQPAPAATTASTPPASSAALPSATPVMQPAASSPEDHDDASAIANPTLEPQVGRPAIEPSTIGFLQVASYGDRANAERMLQRLQQAGIAHAVLVMVQIADQQLWRVHIGPMRADEAATVAAHMQSLGFGSPPFFKQ